MVRLPPARRMGLCAFGKPREVKMRSLHGAGIITRSYYDSITLAGSQAFDGAEKNRACEKMQGRYYDNTWCVIVEYTKRSDKSKCLLCNSSSSLYINLRFEKERKMCNISLHS